MPRTANVRRVIMRLRPRFMRLRPFGPASFVRRLAIDRAYGISAWLGPPARVNRHDSMRASGSAPGWPRVRSPSGPERNDRMNAPLDAIAQHAHSNADGIAVVVDVSGGARPSTTTWAELNALVNRLAHGLLAAGARPGERLVWCGPNSLEVLATIHAARKLNLVAV